MNLENLRKRENYGLGTDIKMVEKSIGFYGKLHHKGYKIT